MVKKRTKVLSSSIIVVCMLLSTMMPSLAALAKTDISGISVESVTESVYGNYPTDPEKYHIWKESLKPQVKESNIDIALMSSSGNMMYNNYIEAYVNDDGKFTMGTTGGNPNIISDDNKKLLYGHPSPWSSETLIRINNEDSIFYATNNIFSSDGTQCTSIGMVDEVEVKQVLTFETSPYTSRQDIMSIKYVLTNKSATAKNIGGRIMLDTQLGHNDGAPFRVPGVGDVTTEMEFVGDAIPQYWQAFDNLSDPGVVASGTFYRTEGEKPDKVQFAYWASINGSSWHYSIENGRSVTNDSAVAVYFNPISVSAGQSRTMVTYYGLSDFTFGDLTGELGARITAPSSLQANVSGTAYMDNPFTVTAYIENQTAETLSNVQATLTLPSGLTLTGSQANTLNIGNLESGAERQVSWRVWAVPQSTAKTLSYNIDIISSSATKNIPMSIFLPRVNYMDVNSLTLNKTSLTLNAGNTSSLVATIHTETSSIVAKKYEVRWETTNTKVATVSPDGVVTAVGNGTATIKAISADNRKMASCTVIVAPRVTTEIDLWTLSSLAYYNFTNLHKGRSLSTIASQGTNVFGSWKAISFPTKTGHIKSVLGGFVVDNVMNDNKTSFYGVSFKDQNYGVVIAYRGSNDPMIGWSGIGKDWLDDISFGAFDNLPEQFYQALQFYRLVKEKNPNKTIRLTGHSLGGALAAFVSIIEDVESTVFCAPSGLIIDLTYFINANYIDHFQGIDKWKFKNHYNTEDLVGNRNPDIYRAVSHIHNSHHGTFPPGIKNSHDLESLVTVTNGKISLTHGSGGTGYKYYDKWERVLNSTKNPNYNVLYELGMSPNELNGGRLGRVMLGRSSGNQVIMFPDNLVETRRNVMFLGGGDTTAHGTSSWWGDYYYLSKSGIETVHGRSGDDTYIVFGKGNNIAWIFDSSGKDTIWYKDVPMNEITVTTRDNGGYSIKAAGGSGSLVVDKKRDFLQPKMVIKDKYGEKKKITDFNKRSGIALFSEEETSNENLRNVEICGNNISIEIFDENMQLLGGFDNRSDKVETTDYASVFMYSDDNPRIDIDLFNNGRFVEVRGDGNISYSIYDLSAEGTSTVIYELESIDIANNSTLLVDNILFSATLSKNGVDQNLTPNEYILPVNIETISDNIEIYAGQNRTISLTFTPDNVVSKEVDVEISGDTDSIFVTPNADGTIDVVALSEGNATIDIFSPFDSNVSTTIPITIKQEDPPQIMATINNNEYSSEDWANDNVIVDIVLPSGYDKKFINTGTGFEETVNGVVVNSDGINNIYAFAQDSTNNKITKTAHLEVKYDDKAPEILNVQNGMEYYIDKRIAVYDENLSSITVNGIEFADTELADGRWVTDSGQYTIIATDLSGKATNITFEIKSIPDVNSLTKNDADLVTAIRNEFEDNKYLLSDERRAELNLQIYNLEQKLSALQNEHSSEADITGFNVDGQLETEMINSVDKVVMVSVHSNIDLSNITPIIGVSDGAQISPNPFEAQNFEEPVIYTVTAVDGTMKNWSVSILKQTNDEKPELQDIEVAGNSIVLEFDTFMDSDILLNGIELHKQGGVIIPSEIISSLANDKVISLKFDVDFATLAIGEYYISLKPGAVKSVDGVRNEEITMIFDVEGLSQVIAPTSNVASGVVNKGANILLSTTTAEAVIYYTTDGTTPTRDSNLYSSPIVVDGAVTIKAIAVKDDMADSDITTFSYAISSEDTNSGDDGSSGSPGGNYSHPQTKVVWSDIQAQINNAKDGESIIVDMKGETVLPSSIIDTLKGRDVKMILNMGTYSWEIDGQNILGDIPAASPSYDFKVTKVSDNNLSTMVKGEDIAIIELAHRGVLPFAASLEWNVGTSQSGNRIFLIYYNETTKQLEFQEVSVADSNGNVKYNFGHASRYLLTSEPFGIFTIKPGMSNFELPNNIYVSNPILKATELYSTVPVLFEKDKSKLIKWSAVIDNALVFITPNKGWYKYVDNNKVFSDIDGHWAVNAINFITARELFVGVGEDKFDPNGNMTRAMFATVLSRLNDTDVANYISSPFTDVEIDAWYGKAVAWAADKGIVNGYSKNLFGPNDFITREQMAVMLHNYMKVKEIDSFNIENSIKFDDYDKISDWGKIAVSDMSKWGLINGVGNNLYAPKDTANRASVAQILMRLIVLVNSK